MHMYQSILSQAPTGFIPPHELSSLPPQTPILVGFSGGADSILLLHLLAAYGKVHHTPIYAAHFHHGIRGQEADEDLAFCQTVAESLGIPLLWRKADIPALAEASGRSLELEARLARYAFFEQCMAEHHIPLLATAHHADDQLETLLLRFLRGTGMRGMGGIHPVRDFGQGHIIRPLLSCTKADILRTCQAMALAYVTDSTNDQDDATRNRLRHHLIPLMETLTEHGHPTTTALRLSAHAREDEDFITGHVQEVMASCPSPNQISLQTLQNLHPAIGKRVISQLFDNAQKLMQIPQDGQHSLSAKHMDALWTFCQHGQNSQSLHLPGQMQAVVQNDILVFTLQSSKKEPISIPLTPLSWGQTSWCNGNIIIEVSKGAPTPCHLPVIASATFPDSVLPLSARSRATGDVICSHGMHKKLKKLLCDKGVPQELRDILPLICYGEDATPLWYPTVAFADGFPPPSSHGITITIFENFS